MPISEQVEFHPALYYHELKASEEVPALALYDKALKNIQDADVEPDAIITYWDFPATIIAAMLNNRLNLVGPKLRSLFKCEHKAWSRAEQRKVIFDHLPLFTAFDPHSEDAYQSINLVPPFWIKPVKSFRSYLSYRVNDRSEFEDYRAMMQKHVDGIYQPFVDLMKRARMPEHVTESPLSCIAESSLSGHMCTLEGYATDNDVISYGIVDSIREKHSSSFQRYQYPSQLPLEVQYRMMDIARRVITQLDLHDSCFNIEYFYNQTDDQIYLLEINPRTSQSHSELFERVHGFSQFQILLDVALGRKPKPLQRQGHSNIAAKFMYRVEQSGTVRRAPTPTELSVIEEKYPGSSVKLLVKEEMNLDDLLFQDGYSFEVANIFLGAYDEMDLMDKYHKIIDELTFDIEPPQHS